MMGVYLSQQMKLVLTSSRLSCEGIMECALSHLMGVTSRESKMVHLMLKAQTYPRTHYGSTRKLQQKTTQALNDRTESE